jgi:transcription initiation factor TFIIIB Brf1 subunit/transcription initiation factor TFIIB
LDTKAVLSVTIAMKMNGKKADIPKMLVYAETTKEKVSSGYKVLKKTEIFSEIETRTMPADIVVTSSKHLGLKPEVKKAAELIARNFTKHCIGEGKKPATIAGVSFFMAITNFGDL